MRFEEFVAYTKEYGKRETDLLLVLTSYVSYADVERHLGDLAKQTFTNFNLLLVLGLPFDDVKLQAHLEKKKYPFGIVLAKENERRGCTGGFFEGQKYALEKEYKYIVMADDDYVPIDRTLMESLYKNREKGYVVPTVNFVEGEYRKQGFGGGPAQYSLFSVEVFKKYGLYYMPLFHGADDAEFVERMGGRKGFQIQERVEHPYIAGRRLFSLFDRALLFLLQAIIIIKDGRTLLYNMAQFAFMLSVALFFLPKYGRRIFAAMSALLLTYTYGKKAHAKAKSGYEEFITDTKAAHEGKFETVDEMDAKYIDEGGRKKLGGIVGEMLRTLRKNVVVENTFSFSKPFFLSILARKVHVRLGENKYLLLGDNGNVFLHFVKLLAFAVFLPAYFALLMVLFVPIKMLKQPKTMGYGLEGEIS